MRYNPALDGLRAVAILLVLACHTELMPGGWIGVDVFFVLSGYLITSILLAELRQTGDISLANFYWRRCLRLMPALGVLVIFQLVRAMFNQNGAEIRDATLIGALYVENWNNVFHFGPFGLMGHTWSLATEEQFYILWPLLLPFVFRRWPLAWLGAALVAMMAGHTFWRADSTAQYSLFIRPVGLVIGCALAFLPAGRLRMPAYVTQPLLLGGIVAVGAYADRFYLLAPLATSLLTAGLIVRLQSPVAATASFLSSEPIRYIGKISYGLYLYHWPIFMLGEKWKPHNSHHLYAAGLIVLIFVVASLSYEFVEKPFLRLKEGPSARPALSADGPVALPR